MSPLDLVVPDVASETIPFSVRLAERRTQRPVTPARPASNADRRAHHRRAANELDWLRTVRLTRGNDVRLIDLSEGGALLEVEAPLKPGTILTLEISGSGLETIVPLEVLRCYIASLRGEVAVYRGACAFTRPIELPGRSAMGTAQPARFVGTDAALMYLVTRCAAGISTSADDVNQGAAPGRTEILHVLDALNARKPAIGTDPLGRYIAELLGAMLPAMHRESPTDVVLAALEQRLRSFPDRWQSRLQPTFERLGTLIAYCAAPPAIRSQPASIVDAAPVVAAPEPELTHAVDQIADTVVGDLAKAPATAAADSAFQKLVVRFGSGAIIKGFSQDFHPSRPQFSLWPSINASADERVVVPIANLKAVFFVRDFQGNSAYRERKTFAVRGQGRRVEVTFSDGESVLGTTLNYRPDAQGFFVVPADAGSNNIRVFVVASSVRRVRFL